MIAFFIVSLFLGVVLAVFLAPALIVSNKRTLKQMDDIIAEFYKLPPEEQAVRRQEFVQKLAELKARIFPYDKLSLEAARDKFSMV